MTKTSKTDLEVMQRHFRLMPAMLDMAKTTDILGFAEKCDGELGLEYGAIVSLVRLGHIVCDEDTGVYYWPAHRRGLNALKVAA